MVFTLLAGGFFVGGYWVGHRSPPPVSNASGSQAALTWQSALGSESALARQSSVATVQRVTIPVDATPEMKEFLQDRETLTQKMAELRSGGSPTPVALAQFQKDNADLLKRMHQLSQTVTQQQAQKPVPAPPPLKIPPNASPKLAAYLKERDQLMRDQIAFINQHRTDVPAARQAAMQQWRTQNLPRLKKLQQEGQALAQNSAATPAVTK